jgi:hypothetical protein
VTSAGIEPKNMNLPLGMRFSVEKWAAFTG